MRSKSILTSRTFYVAVLQAVAGLVMFFAGVYPEVGLLMQVKSVIDVVIRILTDKPVHVA